MNAQQTGSRGLLQLPSLLRKFPFAYHMLWKRWTILSWGPSVLYFPATLVASCIFFFYNCVEDTFLKSLFHCLKENQHVPHFRNLLNVSTHQSILRPWDTSCYRMSAIHPKLVKEVREWNQMSICLWDVCLREQDFRMPNCESSSRQFLHWAFVWMCVWDRISCSLELKLRITVTPWFFCLHLPSVQFLGIHTHLTPSLVS